MPDRTAAKPFAQTVRTLALAAVVLGVLPFVLDTGAPWTVLGPLVAAAFVVRAGQLVWQRVLSTSPRHLGV